MLFGRNVACYKFALAKSLLELAAEETTFVSLEDLAMPYSRHVIEHLANCDAQSQKSDKPYPFLEACRQFNQQQIDRDRLMQTTAKEGFKVVLDKFHNVGGDTLPVRFYEKQRGGITLTDELFRLHELQNADSLPWEIEARWKLVELAWSVSLPLVAVGVTVGYDSEAKFLFAQRKQRRVDLTSCRDALNGYQKGKCFYCFAPISVIIGADNLTDIDHFFPHALAEFIQPIDGVWNLVLSCQQCNRGEGGKFERLPHLDYLARLHKRNEFLISSHHPLREVLMQQTGKTIQKRSQFLQRCYTETQLRRATPLNSTWQTVPLQHPPPF